MKSLSILAMLAVTFALPRLGAAADINRLDELFSEKSEAANTLLSYPSDVRQAALEASLYPNTLSELDQRQKQTSEQFQKLLSSYPRKTQERVYNLVRYPDLLEVLAQGGEKSKDQIKALAKDYPKDVQEAAQELGRKEFPLLQNIQGLYAASDRDFERMIQPLPGEAQSSFRTLMGYPEVLKTLADNRDLTLAMGDAYRLNPDETMQKLSELSADTASQNQEALEDYRETLKNDPKAREELQRSAQEFAQENGYSSYQGYDYAPPVYGGPSTVINISVNPYPYWFGYPFWYIAPIWRPYPLWYFSGFYGFGSSFYVWNYPSYYYTNWFYRYPRNFYRYPYLSSCYGNYYYRWRNYRYYNGFHPVVRSWHHRYRNNINEDLWRNDRHRVDRWRDFGHREEIDRRRHAGQNPSFRHPDWKKKPEYRHWQPGQQDRNDDNRRQGQNDWDRRKKDGPSDRHGDNGLHKGHDKDRRDNGLHRGHDKARWDKNRRDKDTPSHADKNPRYRRNPDNKAKEKAENDNRGRHSWRNPQADQNPGANNGQNKDRPGRGNFKEKNRGPELGKGPNQKNTPNGSFGKRGPTARETVINNGYNRRPDRAPAIQNSTNRGRDYRTSTQDNRIRSSSNSGGSSWNANQSNQGGRSSWNRSPSSSSSFSGGSNRSSWGSMRSPYSGRGGSDFGGRSSRGSSQSGFSRRGR